MPQEKDRVAAVAAGVFVTLLLCLVILTVVSVTVNADTEIKPPPSSDLFKNLMSIYDGLYVNFGVGRRSERDLPVCGSDGEACNLAHQRYWLKPITERLCRCADKSNCPLHFTGLNDIESQHVSNRAQLKFCSPIIKEIPDCTDGQSAMTVRKIQRKQRRFPSNQAPRKEDIGYDTHSTLMCHCHWPNQFRHNHTTKTSPRETLKLYTCNELPRCNTGDVCGHIRADTLESYYTCSCPTNHLCIFTGQQQTKEISKLHFKGHAYTAWCTPNGVH